MSKTHELTGLLQAWRAGSQEALDRLVSMVYQDVYRQAARKLASNQNVVLLQPTVLINDVFVALLGAQRIDWQNRAHFFKFIATVLRNILLDYIRKEHKSIRLSFYDGDSQEIDVPQEKLIDYEILHDALNSLASIDERKSLIVELRFFAGLSQEEVAEVMNISLRTVQSDWTFAKAWLTRELTRT